MLTGLLLFCLFFGLISAVAPKGRGREWVGFLLIIVLFLSLGLSFMDGFSSLPSVTAPETGAEMPDAGQTALHTVISAEVYRITGQYPAGIESDLVWEEGDMRLSYVRVILSEGQPEEVKNALEKTFSFRGFTVIGPE